MFCKPLKNLVVEINIASCPLIICSTLLQYYSNITALTLLHSQMQCNKGLLCLLESHSTLLLPPPYPWQGQEGRAGQMANECSPVCLDVFSNLQSYARHLSFQPRDWRARIPACFSASGLLFWGGSTRPPVSWLQKQLSLPNAFILTKL